MRGFAFTRSFTHPYWIVQVGPLWVLRDAPRKSGDYRKEEVISFGLSAEETVRALGRHKSTGFALCVIHGPEQSPLAVKEDFKSYGFRLLTTEPLFVCETKNVPRFASRMDVRRVITPEDAERVRIADRRRQILPEHLEVDDAPLRLYAAFDGDRAVGWVRSIRTGTDSAWVSNMFVVPDLRRKGIGKALMSAMLVDDSIFGIKHSVLLASTSGSKLYPALGYRQIGLLQLFSPRANITSFGD